METKKKSKKQGKKNDIEINNENNNSQESQANEVTNSADVNEQPENLQSKADNDADKLKAAEDRYLRLQADFDNYRKRIVKERQTEIKRANKELVLGMLPVVDNLERALAVCEDLDSAFGKGIDMVYKQLLDELNKNGVEIIDAENKPFDPSYHQAVAKEAHPDTDSDMVIAVFQKGYTLHNEVLRPAVVKVSE